jgi:uncharacterized lipoprotein YbaY
VSFSLRWTSGYDVGLTPFKEITRSTATLTGTVYYITREIIPPVTLVVQLWNTPASDSKPRELASTTRQVSYSGSLAYTLEYDLAELKEEQAYSVTASLYLEGRLYKTSDKHHPVNLPQATELDIFVEPVKRTSSEVGLQGGTHGGNLIDLQDLTCEPLPNPNDLAD